MKTILVIYHRADFDGLFCREIARKYFRNNSLKHDAVGYVGWDYGDPVPDVAHADEIYMLDISIAALMGHQKLIWIDHHKSAIDQFKLNRDGEPIRGYRIDGVAACRLTWQYFFEMREFAGSYELPGKQSYIDRTVSEPWAVRLAGEYDIWDKRDPDAELLQHGLRSQELFEWNWLKLLTVGDTQAVSSLLKGGKSIRYSKQKEEESIIKAFGFTIQWEGLTWLVCNHARFNSHLFTAGLRPEHEGCFGFNWSGKEWRVSLYGVPGKDIDLSVIAVKYGGGGHRGACGFRTDKLPFL